MKFEFGDAEETDVNMTGRITITSERYRIRYNKAKNNLR